MFQQRVQTLPLRCYWSPQVLSEAEVVYEADDFLAAIGPSASFAGLPQIFWAARDEKGLLSGLPTAASRVGGNLHLTLRGGHQVVQQLFDRLSTQGFASQEVSLEMKLPRIPAYPPSDQCIAASVADVPQIHAMVRDIFPNAPVLDEPAWLDYATSEEKCLLTLRDGQDGVAAAEVYGKNRETLFLYVVALPPSMRGRGLGKILTAGLLAWGSARGAEQAILWVREDNGAARHIYQSFGFICTGERVAELIRGR